MSCNKKCPRARFIARINFQSNTWNSYLPPPFWMLMSYIQSRLHVIGTDRVLTLERGWGVVLGFGTWFAKYSIKNTKFTHQDLYGFSYLHNLLVRKPIGTNANGPNGEKTTVPQALLRMKFTTSYSELYAKVAFCVTCLKSILKERFQTERLVAKKIMEGSISTIKNSSRYQNLVFLRFS